ncbi:bpX6 domain-containing protein [Halovulum sp. GXIMD14793]
MALKLKKSPLPERITPPQPLREWIWTKPGSYQGVLASSETALLPLLIHPGRVLRLFDGGFCLFFEQPVQLDPADIAAVPLRRIGPETYASYDIDQGPAHSLSVIHQGEPHVLSLKGAEPVDPIIFWDFSAVPLVQGTPPPASQAAIPSIKKANKDTQPELNCSLKAIAQSPEVFENVQRNISKAKDSRFGFFARASGDTALRLMATLSLIIIYIFIIISSLSLGAGIGPLGVILAMVFLGWFFGFFGRGTRAVGSKDGYGAAGTAAQPQRGLLDGLRGLALWNTSLGNNLRRQIQRHLDEVSNMIDRGDIDRALKRALSIAESEERKERRRNPLMTSLPKPRATLDFDLNRNEGDTVALPGDWGFAELRQKYVKLAEDLSAQGDHRRAAYIYSELLQQVNLAIAELEKIKAYEDAAKLATARKQPGQVLARLWYLAGKKDIALLVARRYGCMQTFAEVSENDPEFAAFVRTHWVEDLIAEGDLPRAVQESADNPRLAELHLRVLANAIGNGHLGTHPVLERAVQSLPWHIDALNSRQTGDSVGDQVAAAIYDGISQPDAGEIRQKLKTAAERMENDNPRKPALADALIRASLAYDGNTPYAIHVKNLRNFANICGCNALAEDLRQIHRAAPDKAPQTTTFPLPRSGSAPWTMAAALAGGATLLGAPTGELTFVDPTGAKRWTDHLPDLVGLVPVASGRLVLLVQGRDEIRRISVLDTARRTYRSLGSTKMLGWSNYAGDGIWQVQTPTAIGALDLTKLLDSESSFELLWSITQTVPVKVLAFHTYGVFAEWLTQRIDRDGPGLMERWQLNRSFQHLHVWLESESAGKKLTQSPHVWRVDDLIVQDPSSVQLEKTPFYGPQSTYENERDLSAKIKSSVAARKTYTNVTSIPPGGACALEMPGSEENAIELRGRTSEMFACLKGHEIIAQSATKDQEHLVVLTKSGLLVLCNFKTMSALAV